MSDDIAEETAENYDNLGLTEEELKAVKAVKSEDEDDVDNEETEEDSEEAAPETAEATESDEDESAEPEVEVEAKGETDTTFAPVYSSDSTEGLTERLEQATKEFDERSEELANKYENGDLSFSEYRKAERQLNTEYDKVRNEATARLLKAEIAAEHSHQAAQQKWELEQSLFFQDNPGYKEDAILRGALGAQLEALYADEANAGKSGIWFLREAGRLVDARFNRETPAAQAKDLDAAKESLRKKAAKPVNAPKTLASVPTAEANQDSGEFAHIDKLTGLDFERALSRLTPDQYERYMAA